MLRHGSKASIGKCGYQGLARRQGEAPRRFQSAPVFAEYSESCRPGIRDFEKQVPGRLSTLTKISPEVPG